MRKTVKNYPNIAFRLNGRKLTLMQD